MSRRYPQLSALLFGGGSLAASVAWAFAALPGWAAVLLTFVAAAPFVIAVLIPMFALGAVTWVGVSTECTERRKSAEKFFGLFLEFFKIIFRNPGH